MNVVFLLLTSVSAGDAAVQPAAPAAAAPIVSTPIPGGCGAGGGCGAVADACGASDCCEKPRLLDRLRARFSRSKDCCEPACAPSCAPAPACCAPAPVIHHAPAAAPCCGAVADTCCEKRPGFFARLRARKHKGDCCQPSCCDSGCASGGCGTAGGCAPSAPVVPGTPIEPGKPAEPIKKMPVEGKTSLSPVAPVTPAAAKVETESKLPFEVARRHEDQRGSHAANYGKLTGQLAFVHADGGIWVLRYADLAEEDRNGGSVILARDRMMNNYRDGDLVTVQGRIISQKGSSRLGGPLYQVDSISLVDRPAK